MAAGGEGEGKEGKKGRGAAAGYLRPPAATAMEGSPCGRQEPRRCGPAPSGHRLPPAATAHRAPGTHRAAAAAHVTSGPARPAPRREGARGWMAEGSCCVCC